VISDEATRDNRACIGSGYFTERFDANGVAVFDTRAASISVSRRDVDRSVKRRYLPVDRPVNSLRLTAQKRSRYECD
jgi:hypothetical protein